MALILAAWWLYGEYGKRVTLRDVEISIQGARVVGVGITSTDLEFTLRFYNPNNVDAQGEGVFRHAIGVDRSLLRGVGGGLSNSEVVPPVQVHIMVEGPEALSDLKDLAGVYREVKFAVSDRMR